jgi:hypothetical protein
MMSVLLALLRRGIRLLLFAAMLLAGIQIPAFVTQYEQRVDAHFQEVSLNVRGFQQTADALFDGNLDALVNYYRSSNDVVFTRDAQSVANIVQRYRLLLAEQQAMQGNALGKVWHVLTASDSSLFDETTAQYSYTIPLNATAVLWGLSVAFLMLICCECLLACGRFCVHHWRSRASKNRSERDKTVNAKTQSQELDSGHY